jgi:hypothetical protein
MVWRSWTMLVGAGPLAPAGLRPAPLAALKLESGWFGAANGAPSFVRTTAGVSGSCGQIPSSGRRERRPDRAHGVAKLDNACWRRTARSRGPSARSARGSETGKRLVRSRERAPSFVRTTAGVSGSCGQIPSSGRRERRPDRAHGVAKLDNACWRRTARSRGPSARSARGSETGKRLVRSRERGAVVRQNDGQSERLRRWRSWLKTLASDALCRPQQIHGPPRPAEAAGHGAARLRTGTSSLPTPTHAACGSRPQSSAG